MILEKMENEDITWFPINKSKEIESKENEINKPKEKEKENDKLMDKLTDKLMDKLMDK